jgi:ApbE superfamily uncharacterized protein (UPF0280 family)
MKRVKTIIATDNGGDVELHIAIKVIVKHRALTRGESRTLLNKLVDDMMFNVKNAPYIDTSYAEMALK